MSSESYYGGLDGRAASSVAYVFPALIFLYCQGGAEEGLAHTHLRLAMSAVMNQRRSRESRDFFLLAELFLGGGDGARFCNHFMSLYLLIFDVQVYYHTSATTEAPRLLQM